LTWNKIGAEGAKYLAEALKSRKVLKIFIPPDLILFSICNIQLFLTDTNDTRLELE